MKKLLTGAAVAFLFIGGIAGLGSGGDGGQIRKIGPEALKPGGGGRVELAGSLEVNDQTAGFEVGNVISGAIKMKVTNKGNGPAKSFSVKLILSPQPLGQPPFPYSPQAGSHELGQADVTTTLPPMGSTQVSFSGARLPDSIAFGRYYFTAVIDPDNAFKEENESDNYVQDTGWVKAMVTDSWMTADGVTPYWYFRGKGFGGWHAGLTAQAGSVTIPMTANGWSDTLIKVFAKGYLPPGSQTYEIRILDGGQLVCRPQSEVWGTVITAINPPAGPAGADVGIMCVNNGGSQGTRKVCLTNGAQCLGEAVVTAWASGLIKARMPALPPGNYLPIIFEGTKSVSFLAGQVSFTIQ